MISKMLKILIVAGQYKYFEPIQLKLNCNYGNWAERKYAFPICIFPVRSNSKKLFLDKEFRGIKERMF